MNLRRSIMISMGGLGVARESATVNDIEKKIPMGELLAHDFPFAVLDFKDR